MGVGGSLAGGTLHARLLFSLYETALRWFQRPQIHLPSQKKKKKKKRSNPKHADLSRGRQKSPYPTPSVPPQRTPKLCTPRAQKEKRCICKIDANMKIHEEYMRQMTRERNQNTCFSHSIS
jgi:hypothetical protein